MIIRQKLETLLWYYITISSSLCSARSYIISKNFTETPAFIPKISRLLRNVPSCDIRIFHDGLQEFQFDSSYQHPTTIFIPSYSKYKKFSQTVSSRLNIHHETH